MWHEHFSLSIAWLGDLSKPTENRTISSEPAIFEANKSS